jgi:hypothetical protein
MPKVYGSGIQWHPQVNVLNWELQAPNGLDYPKPCCFDAFNNYDAISTHGKILSIHLLSNRSFKFLRYVSLLIKSLSPLDLPLTLSNDM